MKCSGSPHCVEINDACNKESSDCPSVSLGASCWATSDVPCCRRNDKSRCVYCSVYLHYLSWTETGELCRIKQATLGDDGIMLPEPTTT